MPNVSVEELVKRYENLKSERGTREAHWQEIAKYCLPTKATITQSRTPGSKLGTTLYDSTAQQSLLVFAAGLHSYLTNPSSRWFELAFDDKALMDIAEIRTWLKDTEERIFYTLNNSNFNQQVHECYMDFGAFGNANFYEEKDEEEVVRFYARPVSEVLICENVKGMVDAIFRYYSLTARQASQRWEDPGEKVNKLIEAKKYDEKVFFLHAVFPRHERTIGKQDAKNKPFASLHIEPKTKKLLEESGYEEFPFFCPRCYKTSDDVYAYSPSAVALPDIKSVNSMSKTILTGGQKMVNPPIILPDDGYIMPFKTTPGAVNVRTSRGTTSDAKVEIFEYKGNLPVGLELENQRRESIKRAYFVDLFLLLANQPKMTATEVRERVNEKMLILGPTLGRLMSELLNPIITRTFNILLRGGRLMPMPPELEGQDYKINYISPLAKAQRMSEAQSIDTFLTEIKALVEVNPQIADNVDFDKTASILYDIRNVPGDILRSAEKVKAIREQRAQAQAEQAQMAQMIGGAGAVKDAAQAEKHLSDAKKPGK